MIKAAIVFTSGALGENSMPPGDYDAAESVACRATISVSIAAWAAGRSGQPAADWRSAAGSLVRPAVRCPSAPDRGRTGAFEAVKGHRRLDASG